MMTSNVKSTCEQHSNRYDCPDSLLDYWPDAQTYGIIIHDGSESVIVISYCPWCGTKLPEQAD
jgi:predicted RNA-binding Zn-ribbon protein involved in translation (DUF1610 family)